MPTEDILKERSRVKLDQVSDSIIELLKEYSDLPELQSTGLKRLLRIGEDLGSLAYYHHEGEEIPTEYQYVLRFSDDAVKLIHSTLDIANTNGVLP